VLNLTLTLHWITVNTNTLFILGSDYTTPVFSLACRDLFPLALNVTHQYIKV